MIDSGEPDTASRSLQAQRSAQADPSGLSLSKVNATLHPFCLCR